MDLELLRNQYVVGIPHYSVAKWINTLERQGKTLHEGMCLCGLVAT
jgi:hypothetical protein